MRQVWSEAMVWDSGGLHKMVIRDVQHPVQDVTSVMSGLVDSLDQFEYSFSWSL